ncbi:hypothetical protein BDZ90DRAFT_247733 [Jaminaea rosea]|uniref:TNase-like domain-containing protein n=1 Tax=Jaminaea rosea TaxID=1569628 RepID=A0A316UYS6_9BASI|nr:hypothetical protein BDZ90DRAFT_247733 [Jaminaea rosea]PWN30144.1 hypothetical protein BDZ90DRAFT_247733 [Jaminaea rosea]
MSAGAPVVMPSPTAPLQGGVRVHSVLSGDTIVVRPVQMTAQAGKDAENGLKILHIAGLAAPRMGSRERDDEPQAFASREFLRNLLIGREIRYRLAYTAMGRNFAHVFLPPKGPGLPDTNVSHEILAAGWAKVHDSGSRRNANAVPEEEGEGGWKANQRAVQDEAQLSKLGIWGPDELLAVSYNMPENSHAFLTEWKGKAIDAIVEQVRDGSLVRVRLLLTPKRHQLINLHLAGIKTPRVSGGGGPNSVDTGGEAFGEESKFFVETRLLNRDIKVTLLAVPQPLATPTPFGSTQQQQAQQQQQQQQQSTASVLIGMAIHPNGDIAAFLLSAGLARVVDWHTGMLASVGGMEKYRAAEKVAKDRRLNIWKDFVPTAISSQMSVPAAARTFEAVVTRVISGDTIHVKRPTAAEQRIQLSSIRQPPKDQQGGGWSYEARECLRKRLIGKTVQVQIDYIKPAEAGFDERTYATVRTTTGAKETKGANVGELLIQRGLATVVRHRRDDEDRSPFFDDLLAAEATAASEAKGIHSGKAATVPNFVEASENAGRAHSYLPGLKRAGRAQAIIDFVASGSRFKVLVPRENARLTLVLAGIKAPRTARNPKEKDEPFGKEAQDFAVSHALQRDVEIEVLSLDKVGGFIGCLYLLGPNGKQDFAQMLVEAGLASVHGHSAEGTPNGPKLFAAEEAAKKAKAGMWHDYTEEGEAVTADQNGNGVAAGAVSSASSGPIAGAAAKGAWGARPPAGAVANQPAPARTDYRDVVISDVRGDGSLEKPFGFSVQTLGGEISQLEQLMHDLAKTYRSSAPAPASFRPQGDVAAKFEDGEWYRAQVLKASPAAKRATVLYYDYGNLLEDVPFSDIKPLDAAKFGRARLAPQASEARLSFVKLFAPAAGTGEAGAVNEYAWEAQERFRDYLGQKLIANVDYQEGQVLHLTLYDPASANVAAGPEASINVSLAKEGWALLDERVPYWKSYPKMGQSLVSGNQEARRRHLGVYEYGDPESS